MIWFCSLRSGQPDFCPGSYCFQIWVLKSSVRGFIFFQNPKILSRGLIFFLNFHTLFAVFYRFQCIWRQKRSKKFACGARGLIVSQNFPPPAGSYYFPKSTKKFASRGFIFSENSQNLPSGVLRRGGSKVNSLVRSSQLTTTSVDGIPSR